MEEDIPPGTEVRTGRLRRVYENGHLVGLERDIRVETLEEA